MSDRDRYLELIAKLHTMVSNADKQSFTDLSLLKFELEALLGRVGLRIKLKEIEQDNQ